ncbi:xanthine dehydrogenase accessory protein XdhC [Pseudaminobacter sp. 19-2017]|uniref:Xanthine dehydrogenase accessory protein XdhC n=1 Tax=Pseudaminobacter soli (ex Zhang et al. 2022) TaxID=2831468 RepID=A0A942I9V8_9HYPH|nr:xanthine dehydrogenase accessory protein XdhC [Pseudaminobacter soli]MBS3649791.1 xanthine dehydrogenase accessory protein XdhC [Pseudaminobacter soli]
MTGRLAKLRSFIESGPTALVEVAEAKGSTPRERGTWMLVSAKGIFGTIGGGQLEFMAIARAREMLGGLSPLEEEMSPQATEAVGAAARDTTKRPRTAATTPPGGSAATLPSRGRGARLSIPLGPEIGQCCGGFVELSIRLVDEDLTSALLQKAAKEEAKLPHVYIFGGGHVGHALGAAFALLPVHATVVETRAEALEDIAGTIPTRLTPVPEEVIPAAPPGSAFIVLTHDHALDFLITAEALKREDAAYVGMIGSKTKKATFRSWYFKTAGGTERAFSRLVSPIGGDAVKDKRPAVIAALAAAEVMIALASFAERNDTASTAGARH